MSVQSVWDLLWCLRQWYGGDRFRVDEAGWPLRDAAAPEED